MQNIYNAFGDISPLSSSPSTSLFTPLTPIDFRLCKLTINGGLSSGSGFLVGPNLLLTAAHCIFDENNNIMPVVFCPGYNNGAYNNRSGWQKIYSYPSWLDNHENIQYDLVLIVLDWNMGNSFGWFGAQSYGTNQEMNEEDIKEYGYPKLIKNAQEQYYTVGEIKNTNDTYFYTTAVNYKGMSGGPILRKEDNYSVGLVSSLISNNTFWGNTTFKTYGRRITQDIIDLINSLN